MDCRADGGAARRIQAVRCPLSGDSDHRVDSLQQPLARAYQRRAQAPRDAGIEAVARVALDQLLAVRLEQGGAVVDCKLGSIRLSLRFEPLQALGVAPIGDEPRRRDELAERRRHADHARAQGCCERGDQIVDRPGVTLAPRQHDADLGKAFEQCGEPRRVLEQPARVAARVGVQHAVEVEEEDHGCERSHRRGARHTQRFGRGRALLEFRSRASAASGDGLRYESEASAAGSSRTDPFRRRAYRIDVARTASLHLNARFIRFVPFRSRALLPSGRFAPTRRRERRVASTKGEEERRCTHAQRPDSDAWRSWRRDGDAGGVDGDRR